MITGCSSGIGRELVAPLLELGWQVIATMRDVEQQRASFAVLAERFGSRLQLEQLDVTKEEERSQVAARVREITSGKLDALVNNAGYGLFGALEDIDPAQIRDQFEVNVLGLMFVTREMLPYLRAARGRIINISSIVGFQGLPLTSVYSSSKFAVEGLTESLWYELREVGVQVALVEPGGHRTSFGDNLLWGSRSSDSSSPFFAFTERYRKMLRRSLVEEGRPVHGVSNAIVRLLERRRMPLRTRCGPDSHGVWFLQRLTPELLFRPVSWIIMRIMLSLGSRG